MLNILKKPFRNIQERVDRIAKNLKSIARDFSTLISEKKNDFLKLFNKKEDFIFLFYGGAFKLFIYLLNKRKYEIYFIITYLLILFIGFYCKKKNLNSTTIIIFKILMGILLIGLIMKLFFIALPIFQIFIDFIKEAFYEYKNFS